MSGSRRCSTASSASAGRSSRDEPGTTRDRLEAEVEWRDRHFLVLDTGGFQREAEGDYTALIRAQIGAAIEEAVLVLFCVDARDGLTASRISRWRMSCVAVRRPRCSLRPKPITKRARRLPRRRRPTLGFGPPLPVSALHDVNVGLLLGRHRRAPARDRPVGRARPDSGRDRWASECRQVDPGECAHR